MANQSAFEDFYGEARHRCLRAVAAHTGSLASAEELVAEAFTRALQGWNRVQVHPSPSAWVVTTALNLQRDRLRRKKFEAKRIETRSAAAAPFDQTIEPQILQAIAELPDRQREVLIHRVILDLSTNETADLLGIDPGTVTTHLRRSLSALRVALSVESSKGS
jgi:RNA polymerase sigma factor (sigma-70 family)